MSKTSLKRFKNKNLLKSYWEENGNDCQVWPVLPAPERREVERLRRANTPEWLELHHILRQPRYKVDNWSNSIIISSIIHDMAHGKFQSEVTTACLFTKWRKAEFDIHELNTAGPKPIRGTIEILQSKLKHRPEYVDMCEQMLATIPKD